MESQAWVPTINTYECMYKDKKATVKAKTPYQAQCDAALLFKAKRTYDVIVVLVAVGDREVIHSTTEV